MVTWNRLWEHRSMLVLAFLCLALPRGYVTAGTLSIRDAALYGFTHANVFHLACNFLFLLSFRPRLWTSAVGVAVAFLAGTSWLCMMDAPTCGLSAACFAMIARRDVAWGVLNWKLLCINLCLAPFPVFNWRIHIVSYLMSYAIWKTYYTMKNR